MDEPLKIFLLMGQSNMAGRGRIGEVPALRNPQVLMFRDGDWTAAVEPLHTDKPDIAGIGPAMSFAVELVENFKYGPVGLVPCAFGGTPLSRWMPGADLYANAVATGRAALKKGCLQAILWHQGESDSGCLENATTYGDRLAEMLHALRTEFSFGKLPFISGELGIFLRNHPECQFYDLVNRQLRALEGRLDAYSCVSAEGLKDNGDSIHFSSASLRQFGLRYAAKFVEMKSQSQDGSSQKPKDSP